MMVMMKNRARGTGQKKEDVICASFEYVQEKEYQQYLPIINTFDKLHWFHLIIPIVLCDGNISSFILTDG